MKRLISLILVLVLTVSLLGGCADSAGVSDAPRGNSAAEESDGKAIVQFVSSLYSGVFAVLYEDGTVGVGSTIYYGDDSGEKSLEIYQPAREWTQVKKLFLNVGCLFALHEDGTVSFVDNSQESSFHAGWIRDLTGVADIAFMEPNGFAFFLMEDGTVKYDGFETRYKEICERWTNVKRLIPHYYNDMFALCEDGSVRCLEELIAEEALADWTGIRDFYTDAMKFYGLKEDGSVKLFHASPEYSLIIPNETLTLEGIRSFFPVEDLMFGLTEAGDLRVSGGEEWFCEEYVRRYDRYPVSLTEFTNIRQLAAPSFYGLPFLTALRQDGTLAAMDPEINERLRSFSDIVKVVVGFDEYNGNSLICGLQSDGNVVALEVFASGDFAIHADNYIGWNAQDIFRTENGVVLGFREDGTLLAPENEYFYFRYLPPAGFEAR